MPLNESKLFKILHSQKDNMSETNIVIAKLEER